MVIDTVLSGVIEMDYGRTPERYRAGDVFVASRPDIEWPGYAEQVRLYGEKPELAAVPGTSDHGWGLAVDLCGGVERFGTPQYAWMVANAGRFGFLHPGWADPGNGREEPWHWEYAGA